MLSCNRFKSLILITKSNLLFMKNRVIVFLGLVAFVFIGVAASRPDEERNLKVLPKDISDADLDSVMEVYSRQLNVGCDFCHSPSKSDPLKADYANDDKPEKEITRQMMRMTAAINKDFFNYTITYKANEMMAVSCFTCHDGFPRPDLKHQKKD